MMNAELAGRATLGELELQMTRATFNTWLRHSRLLTSAEDEYVVGVRNYYAKDWLENRLSETIARTLTTLNSNGGKVKWDPDVLTITNAIASNIRVEVGPT